VPPAAAKALCRAGMPTPRPFADLLHRHAPAAYGIDRPRTLVHSLGRLELRRAPRAAAEVTISEIDRSNPALTVTLSIMFTDPKAGPSATF
jgi:hypothetical protein